MGKDKLVRREGRPSKLSKELITVLNEVADKPEAVILTDQELVEYINDHLPEEKQISYPTFRNYKDGNYSYEGKGENLYLSEFLSTIKRLRRKQKIELYRNLTGEGAGSWQKYAWIGERKFDDLNLTRKVDHTTGGESFNKVVIDDSYMKEIDAADAEIIDED